MSRLFKIFVCDDSQAASGEKFCMGIPVRIAGREVIFPLSDSCHSFEEMAKAVKDVQDDLMSVLKEAEEKFRPRQLTEAGVHFPPEMAPDKVWGILKQMGDEEAFVKTFNQLEEDRRGQVAEHVLTKCNIFSGRAAVFSARYDSTTRLLE